ncbi:MAG: hypothetical protein QJR03_08375 [Sphaerobacter sp.]|nr:hypothetical protein [Sphaerobacter sp.]
MPGGSALTQRMYRFWVAWLVVVLTLAGCGGRDPASTDDAGTPIATSDDGPLSVAAAVARIAAEGDRLAGTPVDLVAYVNPARAGAGAAAPPAGCPVALEGLALLTDRPFPREFTVAGVTLPNEAPPDMPSLKLVVPYELGIIDIPPYARLRGRLADPAYAACADAGRLFVLDAVVATLPGAPVPPVPAPPATTAWPEWFDAALGIGVRYPASWQVETLRNQGAILEARFGPPGAAPAVRLSVLAGQTEAGADRLPPPVLQGERRLAAMLGPARARLVDVPGVPGADGNTREVRLVVNYDGNTVVLATRFKDGSALDPALLTVYSAMAASARFTKPVEVSDPLDPTLLARAELGPGPFITEAMAHQRAVVVSGLQGVSVLGAELVPERAARLAVPGACREFPGQPEGVWLVTVEGVLPSGHQARQLVYLDAGTGERLCQTTAPTSAP